MLPIFARPICICCTNWNPAHRFDAFLKVIDCFDCVPMHRYSFMYEIFAIGQSANPCLTLVQSKVNSCLSDAIAEYILTHFIIVLPVSELHLMCTMSFSCPDVWLDYMINSAIWQNAFFSWAFQHSHVKLKIMGTLKFESNFLASKHYMTKIWFNSVKTSFPGMCTLLVDYYLCLVDISWWCNQMETFSALLVLCAGNSPVTLEFPSQRPVTRGFDDSLICVWINGWVNNGEAGDLRRYRANYDVIVMLSWLCINRF